MSHPFVWVLVAAFGLITGSFLNAVIHRLPRGIGLAHPRRSFCPQCGRSLPWYENLPVLSWLVLRGACAGCRAPIPWRYPLVELLTAGLFLLLWAMFPPAVAGAYMVLAAILVAGTFIDLEHLILPDSLTLGGAVAGVLLSALVPGLQPGEAWDERLRASLFGALLGFAVLFGVVELGKLAFGRKRVVLDAPEPFAIRHLPEGPRLRLGDEDLDLDEFFFRPADTLELELTDGTKWFLRADGVRRGEESADYPTAAGWGGEVAALVVPREAMGFGDVKFMLTLGAFLGWPGALFSIAAGSMLGALAGVALLALRRLDGAGRIPFGPYLAAGALLWVLAGPDFLRWYLGR